jgi:uracil-DNA glycosylase family 4
MSLRLMGPLIPGQGNRDAKIVIVGEAPGKREVTANSPLAGSAGKLLDATLAELGVPRRDVYVTNVVKQRVSDDRGNDVPPNREMVSQFLPELLDELRELNPDVIVALGGLASQVLCNQSKGITQFAGALTWNEDVKRFVLPTFHPSAVIHGQTGYFDDIYNALHRAVRIAKGKLQLPPPGGHKITWELVGHRGEKIPRPDDPKRWTWTGHFEATDAEVARAQEVVETWLAVMDGGQEFHCGLDTESRNTNFFEPMTMLQVYDPIGNKAWAFTWGVIERLRELFARLLGHQHFRPRLHNTSYDRQVIRHWIKAELDDRDIDTMVYANGLTEKLEQTSLKYLARQHCNAPYYEEALDEWLPSQGSPFDQVPPDVLAEYGCADTFYTYLLADILPELCAEENTLELCDSLLIEAQRAFSDVEYHGCYIDTEYADGLEEKWVPIINAAVQRVKDYAAEQGFPKKVEVVGAQTKPIPCPQCIPETIAHEMIDAESDRARWRSWLNKRLEWNVVKAERGAVEARLDFELKWPADTPRNTPADPSCKRCMKRRYVLVPDTELNVRSSKQMQHLCFDMLRMNTGPNGRSCDKDFWAANEAHPLSKLVGDYRETDHLLRNYVRGTVDDLAQDGRIHPDFLLVGTVTGRLAIHNPPLQTLPKHQVDPVKAKMIRKLFKASPGHVIVDADYSNLELFVSHHYSQDPNLLKALTEQDFHRATAAAIFETPYDEVTSYQRFLSKFVTFGIAYGRQAYSLAQGELKEITGGSEQVAQEYIDNFWSLYPLWYEQYQQWQEDALTKGEIQTPLGRKRRWRIIPPHMRQSVRNQAVNFPMQSLASDTCLGALIRLNQRFKENGWGRVLFTVHDSLVCEVKEEVLAEAVELIRYEMEHPSYPTNTPFTVNIEVGPSLGEVEEWEKAA